MAFASSRIGAQEAIIKPCDLCEEEENVNWFCKDCDQSLCDRCKKSHLKSKVSRYHTVLSISEGFVIAKRNISNICTEHDEPFLLFCQTCDKTICSKCLSKHKKHNFIELRDLQSEVQKKLDSVVREKEEEKQIMTKNYDDLVQHENESGSDLKKWHASIEDRVKAIKLAADEEGQKLKESINATKHHHDKEIKESRQKLQTQTKVYDDEIKTIQQELRLQTASSLNDFVRQSTSKLKSLQPLSFVIPSTSRLFSEGKVDQNQIREMIGKIEGMKVSSQENIEEKKETNYKVKFALEIIRRFNLNLKSVFCMCLSPSGSIWIGGVGYVYKMSSDCSTVLHQIPARGPRWPCCYIACLQSGDAVASYGGTPYIDRFTTDGSRVGFTDLSPRRTYDIAVTNQDEVVVNVGGQSVVILSNKGKQLNLEIRVDEGIKTFCMDIDGNIILAHQNSSDLTVLDISGRKVKSTWSVAGNDILRLTCDRYGNILAATKQKEIQVFNKNGEVQRTFTVDCADIIGICVNHENHLLILLREDKEFKIIVTKYLDRTQKYVICPQPFSTPISQYVSIFTDSLQIYKFANLPLIETLLLLFFLFLPFTIS